MRFSLPTRAGPAYLCGFVLLAVQLIACLAGPHAHAAAHQIDHATSVATQVGAVSAHPGPATDALSAAYGVVLGTEVVAGADNHSHAHACGAPGVSSDRPAVDLDRPAPAAVAEAQAEVAPRLLPDRRAGQRSTRLRTGVSRT
ncbi:hypothetical protein GCM10009682_45580 [Luedemannella flava]|uniref:Lipoprotein n=1 Tax=Luedemannella flava TaxID=349316 RepID=A0ABP4YJH0_9ACTN